MRWHRVGVQGLPNDAPHLARRTYISLALLFVADGDLGVVDRSGSLAVG